MFARLARFINAEGMAGPAFVMLVATVAGGGCNFLYQVLMNNYLPNEVAELNTLLAILYIVTVPSSAVQNVIIRYVSKYRALGNDSAVSWLLKRILLFTSAACVALAVLLIIILSVPSVSSTLKLTSTLPVVLLAIGVVISLVSPVGQGTMQALQRFTPFGAINTVNFILKLTLGVGMVLLGFGVSGALGGVIIGIAFGCGASILFVRKYLFMSSTPIEAKEIWRFTVPATVAMLGYTVLTQVDVILASSLLIKEQANYYAAASSFAKIILFLPGAVSTVMFPKLSKAHAVRSMRSRAEDETMRILKTAFAMTIALSGLIVAVYFLLPDVVLNILVPDNPFKEQIAPILQWLGLAMMLLGLANLFMLYGLATDGHAYTIIITLSVIVMFSMVGAIVALGITFTPMLVVLVMFVTGLFIVTLSGLYLFVVEREWRPQLRGSS
jgi:O-antigen/teichoic acid export membrane protein